MERSPSLDRGSHEPVSLSLRFANSAPEVTLARSAAHDLLLRNGVDDRARYAVELTLDELLDNVLRHGYEPGAAGSLTAELTLAPQLITVELSDDARPFDPTRHPEPPAPRSLAESSIGGRGLPLVRAATASMRYRRVDDRNHLTIEVARRHSSR